MQVVPAHRLRNSQTPFEFHELSEEITVGQCGPRAESDLILILFVLSYSKDRQWNKYQSPSDK